MHDSKAVMCIFDALGEWFRVFQDNHIQIPRDFDIDLLLAVCILFVFEKKKNEKEITNPSSFCSVL